MLDVIRQARTRIGLSLFRANDKEIFAELQRAVNRGVDVEVLVTSRAKGGKKKRKKLWKALEATGAALSPYTDPVVKYHAKYLIADDGPALVSSLNFTRKCFNKTCDAILITYDPAIVTGLQDLMAADRHGHPMPEGLTERLIIGPERARRQLTTLIESARTSIALIDAKLSDPGLVTLLNARRAAGVAVDTVRGQALRRPSIARQVHAHRRPAGGGRKPRSRRTQSRFPPRGCRDCRRASRPWPRVEELFRFVATAAAKEDEVEAKAEGGAAC